MKQIKFDEHIKKKKDFKRMRLERKLGRLPRAKPKDPDYEILIDTIDCVKYLIGRHNLEIDEKTKKLLQEL